MRQSFLQTYLDTVSAKFKGKDNIHTLWLLEISGDGRTFDSRSRHANSNI